MRNLVIRTLTPALHCSKRVLLRTGHQKPPERTKKQKKEKEREKLYCLSTTKRSTYVVAETTQKTLSNPSGCSTNLTLYHVPRTD